MRRNEWVWAAGLAFFGCRAEETTMTDHMMMTTDLELDEELIAEVTDAYAKYSDISVMMSEMTEDEAGCPIPVWTNTHGYFYNPADGGGMGIHMMDPTYPSGTFVENRARMLMYDYKPDGGYEFAGLEWYYEPAGGIEPDELPTVFGAPMVGLMTGHTPAQGIHYDLHAWFYKSSAENSLGYFGEFNKAMTVQDWYLQMETGLYASLMFYDPTTHAGMGYTELGSCIEGTAGDVGFPLVNPSMIGALDPVVPDTLLVDTNGLLLALQWTSVDDGSGPPSIFGLPMTPDGAGNYVMRVWFGFRTNPVSFFAPENPAYDCSEEALPVECLPT